MSQNELKTTEIRASKVGQLPTLFLPRSPPNPDRGAISRAREGAARALLEDFGVVGVLEDLHTFLALLAAELAWPLESLLYTTRKAHVAPSVGGAKAAAAPCGRQNSEAGGDLIQGRLTKRRDERLDKRASVEAVKARAGGVQWSNTFPLLGWNAPDKGPLRADTLAYIYRRNADDRKLWELARDTAKRRLADADGGAATKDRFDALQKAYVAGVVRDGQGFYSFCDWRVKDYERAVGRSDPASAFVSAEGDPNAACLRCAATLETRPCTLAASASAAKAEATCRAGVDPANLDFALDYA